MITLHDKYFKPYIAASEIETAVQTLVKQISADLSDEPAPLFIGILNGSFMFVADFVRKYPGNCEVSFVKL
ncbi:MAG: adenylate kinase, partial [Lutibacter sp.]|nr:adenylate kinase [Lutibacter sp.]